MVNRDNKKRALGSLFILLLSMQKSSLFIVITFVVLIFLFSQVSLLNNFSYIFQAKIILVLSLSISVLTRVDVPAQKKNTINKKRIKYKLTTLILIYLILIVFFIYYGKFI